MNLDVKVCERARRALDARFDGRFFIGVTSTGVYCRPVCPVLAPKEANVRYFASAAAAAEAGFRPCLRCRPESSPGTPAWLGTSATVSRALKLIGDGALDGGDVETLAGRLGVGPRHLRRLFLRHLGATPVAVAQTRRLHFAKQLIDETDLPLTRVALAAGFGSIRRFNATFQKTYHRAPRELRHASRHDGRQAPVNEYVFRLAYRPPYDWDALIGFLAARATPGVELADAARYRRTISLAGHKGTIEAGPAHGKNHLELRIRFPEPRLLLLVVERARRIFDLGADPGEIGKQLRRDTRLRPLVSARPGLRVPGAWDGFELAVRAVLGQQVSVKGATTLAGRLAHAFGQPMNGLGHEELPVLFPAPETLAEAELTRIGLPRARADAIRELARATLDGRVAFDSSAGLEGFADRMTALPGIGAWTAQYVAMRALGEPDAFPAGDLGLRKALERGGRQMKPAELEREAEAWRPWRAYAAMHLWTS